MLISLQKYIFLKDKSYLREPLYKAYSLFRSNLYLVPQNTKGERNTQIELTGKKNSSMRPEWNANKNK